MRDAMRAGLVTAMEVVGDRWSAIVVDALAAGPRRFGELQQELGVATNVLSQRLASLVAAGVVLAEPYQQRPPRYSYALTARGHDLAAALRGLAGWAAGPSAPRHPVCGSELEVRWWCPTCEAAVGDPGEDEVIRL